jgi:hypothetical protein
MTIPRFSAKLPFMSMKVSRLKGMNSQTAALRLLVVCRILCDVSTLHAALSDGATNST